jgi:hypothetical protein
MRPNDKTTWHVSNEELHASGSLVVTVARRKPRQVRAAFLVVLCLPCMALALLASQRRAPCTRL